ncbi:LURP-one-related/scramblase family protein [Aerococcus urinaeequi]|uniref:LURP-one-related/scramblase family protein n=1 Tax=Aerococcus urinaeequi TaxID=51665 RepID=UPI003AAB69A0
MKLYMKNQLLSLKRDFNLTNQDGDPVYKIKNKWLSIGQQFRIIDLAQDKEVAQVKEQIIDLMPTVDVYDQNNDKVAEIRKKVSLFRDNYKVTSLDWDVKGNILDFDFRITDENGDRIARIDRKMISIRDTFVIDIEDQVPADVVPIILGVVMAIDLVVERKNEGK